MRGNLAALPLAESTVDVVANLQVIEHLWDQEGFLAECRRVLRPGGRLLLTTPNRLTFSPGRDSTAAGATTTGRIVTACPPRRCAG